MFCLFHAETYKLKKSKSFYICAIATAAFVLLMYSMLLIANNIQNGSLENGTGGVIVSIDNETVTHTDTSIWDTFHLSDLMQEIFSGDTLGCILAIFTSIFVISEFSSGMLKNIAGKGCSRCSIYLSKLAAVILASALIALTGMCTVLAAGRLYIGADAVTGSLLKTLPVYIGLQLLMITAMESVFVLIGEITRNLAGGISIGICTAAFPALFLNILDMQFADSSITPSLYWPMTRMSACPFEGFSSDYVLETILVSIFWTVLAACVGIWHFYKTDIK